MSVVITGLGSTCGDKPRIVIDDVDPEQRAELAETVTRLIREGHPLFLLRGGELTDRVIGYDAETNEWLTRTSSEGKPELPADVQPSDSSKPGRSGKKQFAARVAAGGTEAVRVPRSAGG